MKIAKNVYKSIEESYKNTGIDFEMFISKVNQEGIKIKIVVAFWLIVRYSLLKTKTINQNQNNELLQFTP